MPLNLFVATAECILILPKRLSNPAFNGQVSDTSVPKVEIKPASPIVVSRNRKRVQEVILKGIETGLKTVGVKEGVPGSK